jgi:hypothetical protein
MIIIGIVTYMALVGLYMFLDLNFDNVLHAELAILSSMLISLSVTYLYANKYIKPNNNPIMT